MTRDDVIKWARDTCGYSERMTKDLLDAFDAGAAATREECAALHGHPDVLAPLGNSAWGEAYQDGWINGTAAYRDAIRAMNEKGTTA